MYLKDMGKFLVFGTTIAALMKVWVDSSEDDDLDFEIDPRSSDFLKLRVGNVRVDAYGGFQQYVRTAAQMISGKRKQVGSGNMVELNGEGYKGETRLSPLWKLGRGKFAPVPATLFDLFEGKDMIGNEMIYEFKVPYFQEHPGGRTKTLDEKALSIMLPMSTDQYVKVFTEPNISNFLMTVLGTYGGGIQDYGDNDNVEKKSSGFQLPKAPEAPEAPEAPSAPE
jgi:hypothetical protein